MLTSKAQLLYNVVIRRKKTDVLGDTGCPIFDSSLQKFAWASDLPAQPCCATPWCHCIRDTYFSRRKEHITWRILDCKKWLKCWCTTLSKFSPEISFRSQRMISQHL